MSLYRKALLAWREELEKQRKAALEDRQTGLRERMRRKLEGIFGSGHVIEMEDEHDPDDLVLKAIIEGLHFLAFRSSAGDINIVLLMPCPHCGFQMTSEPLKSLADLGRDLLLLEMSGKLSNHECSAPRGLMPSNDVN